MFVSFTHEWWDLQLKLDSERQFENVFLSILFNLGVFTKKLQRGSCRKKFFSYIFSLKISGLWFEHGPYVFGSHHSGYYITATSVIIIIKNYNKYIIMVINVVINDFHFNFRHSLQVILVSILLLF